MSVMSALLDNKVKSFEDALGAKDLTTVEMKDAINDWYRLYFMHRPTKREDPCQRLPVAVVSKLTKTTFSEYSAKTVKEDRIRTGILDGLELIRKKALQHTLIGGECFLKPVFTGDGVGFGVINRQNYLVLGRNERDEITDIGTAERTESGQYYYTLLERRTVDEAGYLTIHSRLFRSTDKTILGTEVPLATLTQYAALQPLNRLTQPLRSLGLIQVKTPLENCVDGSPDGVSVYAPAAGLIHLINVNEAQINGEFERGESRIIVSGDMMAVDESGERHMLRDHVFTAVDEAPDEIGVTIFSPAFREQSFLARKTEYLRNIETIIGFKRGILSEVEAVERTAKEVTSSEGDYNLTIIDFQQMWEGAVREAVRVCDILGQMYTEWPTGAADPQKDIVIDWGNGILYDEDKTWADYKEMVAAGMLKPEIAVAWKFNLPWETAEDLAKVREKYMPEMESLTGGD